jgi:hypothetical protein
MSGANPSPATNSAAPQVAPKKSEIPQAATPTQTKTEKIDFEKIETQLEIEKN